MNQTATCPQPDTAETAASHGADAACAVSAAPHAARGPQPIDPRLLMHVAGGSPIAGWEPVELQTTSSPKGGW